MKARPGRVGSGSSAVQRVGGCTDGAETAPLVVAHRGAWGPEPENTLPAFEAAVALGADVIEFDVWRCRTGELLVFHDASVKGQPIGSLSHQEVIELSGRQVPLLEEVLDLSRGRIGIDLEMKDRDCAAKAAEVVRSRCLPGVVLLSSFSIEALGEARAVDPEVELGLIWARPLSNSAEVALGEKARELGATVLAPQHRLLRRSLVVTARGAGLRLLPWTVNSEAKLRKFMKTEGVWGVVTDRPGFAIEVRRGIDPPGASVTMG